MFFLLPKSHVEGLCDYPTGKSLLFCRNRVKSSQ